MSPSYEVPASHPRYISLMTRERIVEGVQAGITSLHGLVAQGRGEAFDYLIGERTNDFARRSIDAAVALLLQARHPVLSVNGNVAALIPDQIVTLSAAVGAAIEVNIFHASKEREQAMKNALLQAGAAEVLLPDPACELAGMEHNRRFVNPEGIAKADVVFVPLEDGDRCQALVGQGKKVVTVDLNPLSRTAKTATVTVVDNIMRAVDVLLERVPVLKAAGEAARLELLRDYDNNALLAEAQACMRKELDVRS